jgi:hypothetical protein
MTWPNALHLVLIKQENTFFTIQCYVLVSSANTETQKWIIITSHLITNFDTMKQGKVALVHDLFYFSVFYVMYYKL